MVCLMGDAVVGVYKRPNILLPITLISVSVGFKAPVTPNGDATAFVQRSKTMSARCGIAAEYT